jgi:hypothetical protein
MTGLCARRPRVLPLPACTRTAMRAVLAAALTAFRPGGRPGHVSVKTTAAKSATATRRHYSASPGKSTSLPSVQLSSRHRA